MKTETEATSPGMPGAMRGGKRQKGPSPGASRGSPALQTLDSNPVILTEDFWPPEL